ncbi:MAG TPA: hypothetical protein ENN79_11360 [Desulfobacteraceae bacterium]|nr:hypothetical protein [Desulfobacteraceae bacterium]
MKTAEKARIRLEHWITHNDHHESEYQEFARELENAGFTTAAAEVKRMIEFNAGSNDCLRKALEALPAD